VTEGRFLRGKERAGEMLTAGSPPREAGLVISAARVVD
jgi:hypothetical protein